jgi:hypothetical protein
MLPRNSGGTNHANKAKTENKLISHHIFTLSIQRIRCTIAPVVLVVDRYRDHWSPNWRFDEKSQIDKELNMASESVPKNVDGNIASPKTSFRRNPILSLK